METNVVVARFTGYATVTDMRYRWDYGQKLKVEGIADLPDYFEVHFSNAPSVGTAKVWLGQNGVVDIPDEYLATGEPVYAWIFLHAGETDGETVYSILIPVKKRPKPVNDAPTPVQKSELDTAIAILQTASATATEQATIATGAATTATEAAETATSAVADVEAAATRAEQAAASLTVDSALSETSENPVQNKVVTGAVADLKSALVQDETILEKETTIGVNKWNPNEEEADKAISNGQSSYGNTYAEPGNTTSGFISAVQGDIVRYDYKRAVVEEGTLLDRGTNVFRIAEYDSKKNCLFVSSNWVAVPYTVQKASTAFIRIATTSYQINSIIFGDSSTSQIRYTPYEETTEFDRIVRIEKDMDATNNLLAIQTSVNKWNQEEATADVVVSNSSASLGKLVAQSGYTTSGFLPVKKGNTVMYYYRNSNTGVVAIAATTFRIAEYDQNMDCLVVSSNWVSLPYAVQNANTEYVRVSAITNSYNMVLIDDDNIYQKEYIPYAVDYNTLSYAIQKVNGLINPAYVILPSSIYGVTGQEINIYKENLVLNNRLHNISYIHTRLSNDAVQNDKRTIWNPSASVLTETIRTWEVYVNGLLSATSKSIKECIVPKDTGNGSIKVLIIGDSKVDNGYVSYHFLHNFDDDNMSCTLLGSKYDWSEDNRNEGWGGKTAKWFCTNTESPLSDNGSCNFANYLSAYNIDTPDYVFINLGTNDCAGLSGSNDTFLTEFVTYITQMITSIHAVDSDIVVIVGMCEGVATVKDTNNATFSVWDLNQKISRLHKATINAFDNRQEENIYVCPMYMGMDLTQDYRMEEVPLSQRDADMNNGQGDGKTRMQIVDPIHQSEVGYWKNADYMYALVKYITAKTLT